MSTEVDCFGELTVTTRVMQRSSYDLSSLVSNSIKYKQKEFNLCTLNSLACVETADGYGFMLSGWRNVRPCFDPS